MDKCFLKISILSVILLSGGVSFGMDNPEQDWKNNTALVAKFNKPTILLLREKPAALPIELRLIAYDNLDVKDLRHYSQTAKFNHSEIYLYRYNKANIPFLDREIQHWSNISRQNIGTNTAMSLKADDLRARASNWKRTALTEIHMTENVWDK